MRLCIRSLSLFIFFCIFAYGNLHAQEAVCGAAPALTNNPNTNETIKGDLEGKANILSKFIGHTELGGKIEAAKQEIYKSDKYIAAQKDAYLEYLFCIVLIQDPKVSFKDKMDAIVTYRNVLPPSKTENPSPPYHVIVCTGEDESNCGASHNAYFGCPNVPREEIAKRVCEAGPPNIFVVWTRAGNRCGYSLLDITCPGKK